MTRRHRGTLIIVGKTLLLLVLAGTAIGAIAAGRLGWTNYWGGFVFAPFALVIALVAIFAVFRSREPKQGTPSRRRH